MQKITRSRLMTCRKIQTNTLTKRYNSQNLMDGTKRNKKVLKGNKKKKNIQNTKTKQSKKKIVKKIGKIEFKTQLYHTKLKCLYSDHRRCCGLISFCPTSLSSNGSLDAFKFNSLLNTCRSPKLSTISYEAIRINR